jgi:hypothetical protein
VRVSQLDLNPDLIDDLVKLFAEGATREQIGDAFGVDVWTVTQWRKRRDVQEKLHALIRNRASQILSHTDTKLLAILTNPKSQLSVDQLLKIREAFKLDGATEDPAKAGIEAMKELMDLAADDPALAEALQRVLPSDE